MVAQVARNSFGTPKIARLRDFPFFKVLRHRYAKPFTEVGKVVFVMDQTAAARPNPDGPRRFQVSLATQPVRPVGVSGSTRGCGP